MNNKRAEQTAKLCMLVCAFVACMQQSRFSHAAAHKFTGDSLAKIPHPDKASLLLKSGFIFIDDDSFD